MIKILNYIRMKFPNIDEYPHAMPMNVLKKTPDELKAMHIAGLDMLYLGVESGSDIVKKSYQRRLGDTIIRAVNKAKSAGYVMSCMIIRRIQIC